MITLVNPPKIEAKVHRFLPLQDPRWREFLQRHPRASVFHTAEWLEALRRTYGYESVALTTTPSGADLQNALVYCRVKSWLTGQRLVSLPFSDHCEPLADTTEDRIAILSALRNDLHQQGLQYVEVRSIHTADLAVLGHSSIHTCCLHKVDLRQDIDKLFEACHKSSIQRKIRRAEREGLIYEEGRSPFILDTFYDLVLLTRRRHLLPPQPKRWFQNLILCFGESLKIRVAFKEKRPVAAILTLRFKDTLVYKFGCSDSRFHNLGGMHLLLWRTICEAKNEGLRMFDLGRSDWKDTGLITFKDRWGAERTTLTYTRFLRAGQAKGTYPSAGADWKERTAKKVFPHLPDYLLRAAGRAIYKHIG